MEEKITAIVLKSIPYKESDALLTLYSLEKGKIFAGIKGVKKSNAKLKFASQPFCFGEFIISKKGERNTVTNCTLIDSFFDLTCSVQKIYSASVILDFLYEYGEENEISSSLFLLAVNKLKDIAYGDLTPEKSLLRFLIEGAKEIGYQLIIGSCRICGEKLSDARYFDFQSGGAVCNNCHQGSRILPETYTALKNAYEDAPCDNDVYAIRLLGHYFFVKTEKQLQSVEELVKMHNSIKEFTAK